MTEKRFRMEDLDILCRILDNGRVMEAEEVVECLNNLHEENQRLKQELEKSVEILNREINSSENAFKGLMEEN